MNDQGERISREKRAKKEKELTEYEPVIGDFIGTSNSLRFCWRGLVVGLAVDYRARPDLALNMKYREFSVLVLENGDYPEQVGKVVQWSTLGGWEVISRLEDDNDR